MGRSFYPNVAIIIPCYNHGVYLPEAVESARLQTYPHVECVVVDDGSTDANIHEIMKQLREQGVKVIHQNHQGLAAARNCGICETDAEFFVPLDADDLLDPRFVETLLPSLLENHGLGYCYCYARLFGAKNEIWKCPAYDPYGLLIENLSSCTTVIRRSAFEKVGGYRTDMVYGYEDWDLWLAFLAAGYHGRLIPDVLFNYRKHATGSMLTTTEIHREIMIRKMIEHHRNLFSEYLGLITHNVKLSDCKEIDDELYERLQAAKLCELIIASKYCGWVQGMYGRDITFKHLTDPRERLAAIKNSRFFRMLQAVKRTFIYRFYARRKYGPNFTNPIESK